jgi:uncharacterized membrane protein YdjX (TVP38/TMEM64 family)
MARSFFKKYFSFVLSGIIILGLVIMYFTYSPFQAGIDEAWQVLTSEDQQRINNYVQQFGIWGPLAIIVFTVLQMFLIIFPSWIPIIVAVMAYGFWWGVLISLTGVAVASSIGFYIGKRLKGNIIGTLLSKKNYEKTEYWIKNYAFGTVILFRVSPFFSNDGISFLAGIFGMSFKKYMLATFCGMIPLALAVGYFSADLDRLENGLYWVGGIGTLLYGVYIYLDHKKRKKK